MAQPNFGPAFEAGRRFVIQFDGALQLRPPEVLGTLVAPSGHIVACNPLAMLPPTASDQAYGPPSDDTRPFARALPPGRYPVVGSVAVREEDGHELLACVMVRVHDRRATRWELATRVGQDEATIEDDLDAGYRVDDTDSGCFMDAVAARWLLTRFAADIETYDHLFTSVVSGLRAAYRPRRAWVDLPIDPATGANVIAFMAGRGDGTYPSYVGYDADGVPVHLVTDFLILPLPHHPNV
jgi:hypothetical protein